MAGEQCANTRARKAPKAPTASEHKLVVLQGLRGHPETAQKSIAARVLDAGTQDDIHQAMQAARDVGRYSLHELQIDAKAVCVVSIARRHEGFAQTSAGVVRMPRGTRDDPLFGTELVQFANERTSVRYETTALDVPLTEASVELRWEMGRAMGWARTTSDRLHEAELASAGRLTLPEPYTCWTTPLGCWARRSSNCCGSPTTRQSTTTAATRSAVLSTTFSPRPQPASATISAASSSSSVRAARIVGAAPSRMASLCGISIRTGQTGRRRRRAMGSTRRRWRHPLSDRLMERGSPTGAATEGASSARLAS